MPRMFEPDYDRVVRRGVRHREWHLLVTALVCGGVGLALLAMLT
jgi:uncharacterized membrane protein YsdA (DUF1294 family)